ncbi:alpha/beta-hydrolase [Martensiomyces pterosporus]|nr:alpha/beta-hydrolase [Martensiomyces pterosporus]
MSAATASSPTVAPYGSWKSPISAKTVASASSSTSAVLVDRANPNRAYWLESRPSEGGRRVLVGKNVDDYTDDSLREYTTDKKWNVRTAVHEYGGGAYAVYDGLIVFANWSDQGLYLLDTKADGEAAEPRRIAAQNDKLRYAAFAIHPSKRFVVCVREDHTKVDLDAPATLVAIPLPAGAAGSGGYAPTEDVVLFGSSDFVSSPVFSPANDEIAFYAWNHPDMNWDATTLYRATLAFDSNGVPKSLDNLKTVTGGENDPRESVYQPRFDDEGCLHFISDRSGFWNPYYVSADGAVTLSLAKPMPAEFGEPEWGFGTSTFQPIPGRKFSMVVAFDLEGESHLGILNVATHQIEALPVPGWTVMGEFQLGVSRSGEPVLLLVAGGPTESRALYTYFINGMSAKALSGKKPSAAGAESSEIDQGYVSVPREITFPTRLPPFDSPESKEAVAYAYYYPPANKDYKGPDGELPPLLVLSHGGPTGATSALYQPSILYWTSRGFGVVDVNYGGSTGYGREYRERLYPHFGEVDVEDCCGAALYLADAGLVDRKRLSIMGGSAGGFTTLACLAFRPEVFAVGASLYGISDLEILMLETHKFESQYPVHLVGPYPEAREIYLKRSPIYSVDKLACPAIFLQGLEDKVVPPNQATLMVDALKKKGVPVAHLEFEGEQHGFRQSKNIIRALEAQFYFFGRILGFTPADDIEPVPIFSSSAASK